MGSSNTVLSAFTLNPVRVGGIETYASELSAQLAEIGWKSVLVFLGPPSEEAKHLFALPNTRVEVVEGCGKLAWRPFRAMAKLLAEIRPRIMHLHFMDAFSGYPWLAKWYSAEQVFLTDHNSRPAGFRPTPTSLWKQPLKRLVHFPVAKVFCVSDFVSRCVREERVLPEERIHRVYNGVDLARAEAGQAHRDDFRRRHSIPADRVIVLQVSWLIPEKGIEDLLHAARNVLNRNGQVHFVIAGDGASRGDYQRMAEELGITDHVSFIGIVNDPLGEGLFAACDIACQMSQWEEAFGLTIAEAMASRRPVIATRVGGIPELVRDGESGYLVARSDCDALAERILQLAEDPQLRESMGETGGKVCGSKFDLTRNVRTVIHHYGIACHYHGA